MWMAVPDVLVTDLGDELVLMHAARSEMFSLNESGRVVWRHLPGTLAELSAVLQREYELSAGQANADVEVLLTELHLRGLVQSV